MFKKSSKKPDPQAELEARVSRMMDIDEASEPAASKQAKSEKPVEAVVDQSVAEVQTAPVLNPDKPLDIFANNESPIEDESVSDKVDLASKIYPTPKSDKSAPQDLEIAPLSIDTPQTDSAIDSIVAQEADQVLAAEDAGIKLANVEAEAKVPEEVVKKGHPIFWWFVTLLAIIALAAAYVLMAPNHDLPF